MELNKKNIASGFRWSVVIVLSLVFVPPALVPWLSVWVDANKIASKEYELNHACGEGAEITLSRWFYAYRFSGEYEWASFRGNVAKSNCSRNFRIHIERSGGEWRVSRLEFK